MKPEGRLARTIRSVRVWYRRVSRYRNQNLLADRLAATAMRKETLSGLLAFPPNRIDAGRLPAAIPTGWLSARLVQPTRHIPSPKRGRAGSLHPAKRGR